MARRTPSEWDSLRQQHALDQRQRAAARAAAVPTEDQEHLAFISWCYVAKYRGQPLMRRDGPGLIIHIPNQGERNRLYAVKLARMGVQAGTPDFVLPIKTPRHGGLWIELKRRHGGTVRPSQRERLAVLGWGGQAAHVALGADHCKRIVLDYLAETGHPVQIGHSGEPQIDWSTWEIDR